MKYFLKALFLCLCLSAPAFGQFVTVTSTNLSDSSNNPVSNATITFAPVLTNGTPASYRKGTGGGQVIIRPVSATVTSGAFSLTLVDSSLTNPANICYSVTLTDNVSGNSLLGSGYGCVQPTTTASWCTGTACNFDQYPPGIVPNAYIYLGPIGPQGPPGSGGSSVATRLTTPDWNTVKACGYYDASSTTNGPPAYGSLFFHVEVVCSGDPAYLTQIAYDMQLGNDSVYTRFEEAGSWSPWVLSSPSVLSANKLINGTGFEIASGPGCNIAAGSTPVASCIATLTMPVAQPDLNYIVTGCEINGPSSDAAMGNVMGNGSTVAFAIKEFTLIPSQAVTGGTISCIVVHY